MLDELLPNWEGDWTWEYIDGIYWLIPKEKTVIDEASEIVEVGEGERNRAYGHPLDNHGCTAEFYRGYVKRKYGVDVPFTPEDVCWMHILEKVSRDANMPKRDNLVDTIGYARNIEMIEEERNERLPEANGRDDSESETASAEVSSPGEQAGPSPADSSGDDTEPEPEDGRKDFFQEQWDKLLNGTIEWWLEE